MAPGTRLDADAIEFAENPEPRCACVLLLDTSGSMQGDKINALNAGLQAFRNDIARDALASRRVEVAVVTFDSEVKVVRDFTTADQFDAPVLTAQGLTHMGSAIQQALDLVEGRKATYRQNGVQYYRPWIFLITDGEPQGEADGVVAAAAQRVHDAENAKRVAFFAVGVDGANMAQLASISSPDRPPLPLKGLNFVELFVWLSRSASAVSNSKPGDMVALPAPAGWTKV
ncbi:MAG: VWA domain-containing protein [Bryobacteraceae bacterium]|nr:VWA domain-containing protein [Bryobacteraceae bacterium]